MFNSIKNLALSFTVFCTALASNADDEKNKKDKWDVESPPGKWRSITIDTNETTWSFVDVSPDGKTILFDMLGDIYQLPIEGGLATAVSEGISWDFQPSYSPDGKKIAFISDRDGADNIWLMNADGSNLEQVSKEKKHLLHNPAWSPDGNWLSARKGFVSRRSIAAGEIWMYHRNGGEGLQLVSRPNGDKAQKTMGEPAYSPDGRYLYFSQDNTTGKTWKYNKDATGEIFVIKRLDLNKGDIDIVTGGPGGAVRPVPSPDGKKLAFVKRLSNFKSAIYVRDLTSGIESQVYANLERDNQESAGSHGNTTAFDWTPDNTYLVFWSEGGIHKVNVQTKAHNRLPLHVVSKRRVRETLRFPVEVAPPSFEVKMLRWPQYFKDRNSVLFQALGHLYTKKINAEQPKRLTKQNDEFEFWPDISTDGKKIVYSTWDDQQLGRIKIVSSRGGKGKILVSEPGHYIAPHFSGDGKKVVYQKITGGYLLSPEWSVDPGIYWVSAKGGKPKRVSKAGANPQFNSAGTRIYFSSSSDKGLQLKSVNLQGEDERTLVEGKWITDYSVSPDGKWLAFTEHFNAYIMPFTSTNKTISIGRNHKNLPIVQVSKRAGDFLRWSNDSDQLTWANGATLYTRALKDSFSFISGSPEKLPAPESSGLNLSFAVKSDIPKGLIALKGANIVTMSKADDSEHIIEGGTIIVEGNRIAAIGTASEVSVPSGAHIVELEGKTIIPGLIDTHAHGSMGSQEITPEQNWMQFSNIAFGVTTIHDPSNDTTEVFAHAELQRAGKVLGPRTYSTGTILYGALAAGYTSEVASLEDAKFHVRRLKDSGAISVKSYNQLGRDSRQQIIAAAYDEKIMVMPEGGMKLQHNLNQIVDGHTSIEHALPVANLYDDVAQLWSQTKTGYTPTFGVAYGGIWGENYWYDRTQVWRNPRLMRYAPKQIIEPRSMRRTRAPDHHYNHINVAKAAKRLREKNVRVMIGAHGQREGLAAHWEMWMMEQGGFTPWEALRGATWDAAVHLGMDEDIGSLEVGKLADLVVVNGNPLENLRRSEHVHYTMINGRLYDVSSMREVGSGNFRRQAFFFERESGKHLPPATAEAIAKKARLHHWVH